ncbi:uncharacterized protein MONBRDRAFT_26144 [Monosiga brevicollis MX1]|uniref:Uncharacterized protein n=1 Tax=Monosiga brevicollis TaxID=81824 RepID=A9V1H4_MONBE|nr:uncharacterized protein MONBRDRAFT_26144 [Monosiga brevicollis MX1]EDQ88441.1 predicted protein [Monosiga brevicollis MX1]|eukprot:XP_001746545.1 hypothetical protein [Monosiga brevicollis MX1]
MHSLLGGRRKNGNVKTRVKELKQTISTFPIHSPSASPDAQTMLTKSGHSSNTSLPSMTEFTREELLAKCAECAQLQQDIQAQTALFLTVSPTPYKELQLHHPCFIAPTPITLAPCSKRRVCVLKLAEDDVREADLLRQRQGIDEQLSAICEQISRLQAQKAALVQQGEQLDRDKTAVERNRQASTDELQSCRNRYEGASRRLHIAQRQLAELPAPKVVAPPSLAPISALAHSSPGSPTGSRATQSQPPPTARTASRHPRASSGPPSCSPSRRESLMASKRGSYETACTPLGLDSRRGSHDAQPKPPVDARRIGAPVLLDSEDEEDQEDAHGAQVALSSQTGPSAHSPAMASHMRDANASASDEEDDGEVEDEYEELDDIAMQAGAADEYVHTDDELDPAYDGTQAASECLSASAFIDGLYDNAESDQEEVEGAGPSSEAPCSPCPVDSGRLEARQIHVGSHKSDSKVPLPAARGSFANLATLRASAEQLDVSALEFARQASAHMLATDDADQDETQTYPPIGFQTRGVLC